MERLRELKGLVQKFGVGGGGKNGDGGSGGGGGEPSRDEILSHLPLTKSFIDSLPYDLIASTAHTNNQKASLALTHLQSLDERLQCHTTTISSLQSFTTVLTTLQQDIQSASTLAASLTAQLTTLSQMVTDREREIAEEEVKEVKKREEEKWREYVEERKERVERRKRELKGQLEEFERERWKVLGEGGGVGTGVGLSAAVEGKGRREEGSSLKSVSSRRSLVSGRASPSVSLSSPPPLTFTAAAVPSIPLSQLTLDGILHHDSALDDFLGSHADEPSSTSTSSAPIQRIPPSSTPRLAPSESTLHHLPPHMTLNSHHQPHSSPASLSPTPHPATEPSQLQLSPQLPAQIVKSTPSTPTMRATTPAGSIRKKQPPQINPAIVADEDIESDSEVLEALMGMGKRKKAGVGRKKR